MFLFFQGSAKLRFLFITDLGGFFLVLGEGARITSTAQQRHVQGTGYCNNSQEFSR